MGTGDRDLLVPASSDSGLDFLKIEKSRDGFYVQLIDHIANGYPSPADDFAGRKISLDERYLQKPESTFVGRAKGYSNYPYILPGDFLIVRTDLPVQHNDLAIVYIPGDGFCAKIIDLQNHCLRSLNHDFPVIAISPDEILETRGVVKAMLRDVCSGDFLKS